MKSVQVIVSDPVGLHARPAAVFVKLANEFKADIRIRNLSDAGDWVNAKSILGLLVSAVKQDNRIEIQADGVDEETAVERLKTLVSTNFTLEP